MESNSALREKHKDIHYQRANLCEFHENVSISERIIGTFACVVEGLPSTCAELV